MSTPYHIPSHRQPQGLGVLFDPIDEPRPSSRFDDDDVLLSEYANLRELLDDKSIWDQPALDYDLPSLQQMAQKQLPLPSERAMYSTAYAPSQTTTVRPQDVFCDYDSVMRYLAEQDVPSSPSSECDSHLSTPMQPRVRLPEPNSAQEAAPADSPLTSTEEYEASKRRVGTKAKRSDSEEPEAMPVPKRRAVDPSPPIPSTSRRPLNRRATSDDAESTSQQSRRCSSARNHHVHRHREDEEYEEDNMDVDEDDASEDFRPVARSRPTKKTAGQRRTKAAKPRKPAKAKDTPKKKSITLSTCDCGECDDCNWTCRCPLKYGPRKGQLCNLVFNAKRELDFKRHQEAHAIHEWFWAIVMGTLSLEEASWYSVKYKGLPMGLFCPNHVQGWETHRTIGDGDCMATFTRRDALIRHLKNHTCHKDWAPELTEVGNSTKLDAKKVIEASRRRWEFIQPKVKETIAAQAAGKPLTSQQAAIMKSLV